MSSGSYTHGSWADPLFGLTIGEAFRLTALRHPQSEALIAPREEFRATYQQLLELTSRLSRALIARGVSRGDRVGIWSANRHEWILVQLAAARIGATLVPINPAFRSSELLFCLNQGQISLLVMSPAFRQTDYEGVLEAIRPKVTCLRDVVVFGEGWNQLLEDADSVTADELARREAEVDVDDVVFLMYTSGTTGEPKAAMLSHQGQLNNGYAIGEGLRYSAADRICLPVPLFHSFGNLMGVLAAITHGSAIVLCGEAFEPEAVLRTVEAERCTSLYGVPTMFIAELALPGFDEIDLSSLSKGIMAGAPCPVEVMRKVHNLMHMKDVVVMYGMTETGITTRTLPGDPFEKKIGTVGRAMPLTEIKIIGSDGNLAPRGQPGELCARSLSVMQGYWKNPAATADAVDRARWMHTGDLATLDEDGYVKIVGRIKDLIIRGGENIFPTEIEEFIYNHEAVEEVQVVGVPSERYGEEVMAFVRLRRGATADEGDLDKYCRGAIATYKIPRYWKFVEQYPMTPSGKVQKYRLREAAIHELGLEAAGRIETA
ncbi:MAG: AMP-binding protein [Acidimicrobiaceae bacterium]|nr:AMP-binding protein [Acidimicrobiaceae bacterium]